MSEMNPAESMERFCEGLKKAASRAREMGEAQQDRNWNKLAFTLDGIRQQGEKIFSQRALTEQEVIAMTEKKVREMNKGLIDG